MKTRALRIHTNSNLTCRYTQFDVPLQDVSNRLRLDEINSKINLRHLISTIATHIIKVLQNYTFIS